MSFQPPHFLAQVKEVAVPSVQTHLYPCDTVWRAVGAALRRFFSHYERQANHHHTPAPDYQPGQKVWLSTKDLALQVEYWELAPCYIGPFQIVKVSLS